MLNEKDTWVKFCAGDQSAFRELYDHYYSRMFVWGCKWMNGEETFVRDTLHDFYIYLWEKRERLTQPASVSTYLLTSFKRRLLEQWRREQKTSGIADLADMEDDGAAEAEIFTTQFLRVSRALQTLTPAQREVIELRFLHGLSLQQIAGAKKTSLRTVYNLMHRAIVLLRQEVGKQNFGIFW